MKEVLLTLLLLAVTTAKLCGPGGARAVIAENLLLKQVLIVLRRARQRAPNLASTSIHRMRPFASDYSPCASCSLETTRLAAWRSSSSRSRPRSGWQRRRQAV